MPLILAGADIVIFHHPDSLAAVRWTVGALRAGLGGRS